MTTDKGLEIETIRNLVLKPYALDSEWVSLHSLKKRLETAIMNEEYSVVMNILKELEGKDE